ncbi:Coiled-coil and C2 domain-containing protein 1-like [Lamellibrachia satsuma]|nr:Coiled-coil and C2 domain-containing protein 1-like [Lamellibrachia satsuma]
MLVTRHEQYKAAAMQAKTAGDLKTATKYLGVSKQFQKVIQAMDEDQPVDLSAIPGPPPGMIVETVSRPLPPSRLIHNKTQTTPAEQIIDDLPETTDEDKKRLYAAPPKPATIMEALEQRLEKYKATAEQAKLEGESSKLRRMTRMVKQYECAIKNVKAGQQVDFDELPVPPGFPPIPQPSAKPPAPVAHSATSASTIPSSTNMPSKAVSPPGVKKTTPSRLESSKRQSGSRAQQQASFLRERQMQFKQAALKAKQNGEVELAKKYLRQSKGFDQMIDAADSGLPVDMSQVPSLPDSTDVEGFVIVSNQDCDVESNEMYARLQQELIQQIKTATTNAEHFTQLGDVSSATKFDKMCLSTRKDLDAVKNAQKHGDTVPRFHYETRHFSLVQCCTDLGDNDLEVTVVRGINYSTPQGYSPNDLQTFVKFEFPFPNDDPQKGTSDISKSSNPEYSQMFKLQVNRKSRAFLRVIKLKAVKLEVFYKRGFFKGDKVLGSVTVKLQPLENICVLHDSYNLSEGKKTVGGMLEVKIRVRDPLLGKQVEEVKEKWLVIDSFDRLATHVGMNSDNVSSSPVSPQHTYTSMEVLKYEKQLLDQRVQKLKGKLNKSEELTMQQKSKLLAKQVEDTRSALREGEVNNMRAYMEAIQRSQAGYQEEAKVMLAQGNRDKAQILLTKKKLVEKEIAAMQQKLPK